VVVHFVDTGGIVDLSLFKLSFHNSHDCYKMQNLKFN